MSDWLDELDRLEREVKPAPWSSIPVPFMARDLSPDERFAIRLRNHARELIDAAKRDRGHPNPVVRMWLQCRPVEEIAQRNGMTVEEVYRTLRHETKHNPF